MKEFEGCLNLLRWPVLIICANSIDLVYVLIYNKNFFFHEIYIIFDLGIFFHNLGIRKKFDAKYIFFDFLFHTIYSYIKLKLIELR